MDGLDEIGASSLVTHAIPAALVGGTSAPVPVTVAVQTATNRDLREIAGRRVRPTVELEGGVT